MASPPLPSSAIRDLLGILRVLWWIRWAAGADEAELRVIASVGDDVRRILRAARFEACATTWHQARLAMNQVVRLGEVIPWAEPFLRAGARRVVALPGVPPPPLHAYAAPWSERPGEGEPPADAPEPPGDAPARRAPVPSEPPVLVEPPLVEPLLVEPPVIEEEAPASSGEPLGEGGPQSAAHQ